jgi:hypothetical protein
VKLWAGRGIDYRNVWDPDWHWISKISVLCFLGTLAWGLCFYPLAPYKPCDNGHYCDKRHHYHDSEDYEHFRRWQALLIVVGMVYGSCRMVEWGRRSDREKANALRGDQIK